MGTPYNPGISLGSGQNNSAYFPQSIIDAGQTFYVCSVAGANVNTASSITQYGTFVGSWAIGSDNPSSGSYNTPFATINYANTQCVANRGDNIIVLPGHTEAISAAGGITLSTNGVSVIGIGTGTIRPTINWTATAGTFLISGDNVSVANLYMTPTGIDAVVAPIRLTSTNGGTFLSNCEMYFAKTSYVALKCVVGATAAAANNLVIDSCYFHGDAVANCTNAIQLVGGSNIKITNNRIIGNFTTTLGCINNITAICANMIIQGNVLQNLTAVSTKVVVLLTGSTGTTITGNAIQILSGAAPFTADSAFWGNNYYAAILSTSATLL